MRADRDAHERRGDRALRTLSVALLAVSNGQALLALLGCTVAGLLAAALLALLATALGVPAALPGFLALGLAVAIGVNAAGILLLEQARGRSGTSLQEALAQGIASLPTLLGLAALTVLSGLTLLAVLAVVYLLCKTPVVGPIAFAVVFPLSVVIAGAVFWALCSGMLVALPTVWNGAKLLGSLAQVAAMARSRPAEALVWPVVAGLVAAAVGVALLGVLLAGVVPAIALAAMVFGDDARGWLAGLALQGSNAHALAAGIGGGTLWAMAGALAALVGMQGLNLVYLRIGDGLETEEARRALQAALDGLTRVSVGLGRPLRALAERLRPAWHGPATVGAGLATAPESVDHTIAPASPANGSTPGRPRAVPPESTRPAVAATLNCPHCLSAVGGADRFCAACGYALVPGPDARAAPVSATPSSPAPVDRSA